MVMLALLLAAVPSGLQVENAREEGGSNCATHEAMASELKGEQYRPKEKPLRIAGYKIEVWENTIPDEDRRPDRDRFVYVRHMGKEDCWIRTKER